MNEKFKQKLPSFRLLIDVDHKYTRLEPKLNQNNKFDCSGFGGQTEQLKLVKETKPKNEMGIKKKQLTKHNLKKYGLDKHLRIHDTNKNTRLWIDSFEHLIQVQNKNNDKKPKYSLFNKKYQTEE